MRLYKANIVLSPNRNAAPLTRRAHNGGFVCALHSGQALTVSRASGQCAVLMSGSLIMHQSLLEV